MGINTSNSTRGMRVMPERYGFIDFKFLTDGYLKRLSPDALALYVFLCLVSNREGQSWYSDGRIVESVRLCSFASARNQLVEEGLISWARPVYKILDVGNMRQKAHVIHVREQVEQVNRGKPASPAEVASILNNFRRKNK